MKQIKLLAILFLATISFTSCSDDDSSDISPKGKYTVEGETFKLMEGISIEYNSNTSHQAPVLSSGKQRTLILSTDKLNIKDDMPFLSKNSQNTLYFNFSSNSLEGQHYASISQITSLEYTDGVYVKKTENMYYGVFLSITKNNDNTYKIVFTNIDQSRANLEKIVNQNTEKLIDGEYNGELKVLQVTFPFQSIFFKLK